MLVELISFFAALQLSPSVEKAIDSAVENALLDPSTVEFPYASERWKCTYKLENGTSAQSKFALNKTHIADEFNEEFSIVQSDSRALVGAKATYGIENVEGSITKWFQIVVIDKKDRSFRQISENLITNQRFQRMGSCVPY